MHDLSLASSDLQTPPPAFRPVSDLMTHDVVAVDSGIAIDHAINAMLEHDVTCVPVVNRENRVIGMLSRRDARAAQRETPQDSGAEPTRVRQVMSKHVFKATPDMPVTVAARLMLDQGISTLPIIHEHQLLGIITKGDILRHLVAQIEDGAPDRT